MYNEYFGLRQAPFRITPDTALFYTGGSRGDVLDALVYAITSGEGIIKVVGEVGTGKTMLCRMLEERLPNNVQIAYLANPSLTPEDILHAVALELELDVASDANRLQVMHRLQETLLSRHANNQRVVVLVEEAQSMPVDTLEEIRLLSNLETKNEKLLQIVLFGQPELDDNLAQPQIRQLRERITHSFALTPLGRKEVKDYVAFRLRAAGYRGRDAFTASAYRTMSRASEGLTRRVNIIADKAMLAAFADDTHDVSAKHVRSAVADSEFSAKPARNRRPAPVFALAVVAVVGAAVAGWYAGHQAGNVVVPADKQLAQRLPEQVPQQGAEQDPEPLLRPSLAQQSASAVQPLQSQREPAVQVQAPPLQQAADLVAASSPPAADVAPPALPTAGLASAPPPRPRIEPASVLADAAPVATAQSPASVASIGASAEPIIDDRLLASMASSTSSQAIGRGASAALRPPIGPEVSPEISLEISPEIGPEIGSEIGPEARREIGAEAVLNAPATAAHGEAAASAALREQTLVAAGAPRDVAPSERDRTSSATAVATAVARAGSAAGPAIAATPVSPSVADAATAPISTASSAASRAAPERASAAVAGDSTLVASTESDRGAANPAIVQAASAVQPPPPAASGRQLHETLLQWRLADTHAWLQGAAKNHYSIQLLATDAKRRRNLEAFLAGRERAGHIEKIFVYKTQINARDWYGVLFGEFASFRQAREALQDLPRELQSHQPFIRNIKDINALS